MPKHEDVLKVDSVLRLDECQSIPVNGLRPMSLSLSKDVKALLRSQFSFLVNGLYEGDYQVYRDLIREEFA